MSHLYGHPFHDTDTLYGPFSVGLPVLTGFNCIISFLQFRCLAMLSLKRYRILTSGMWPVSPHPCVMLEFEI